MSDEKKHLCDNCATKWTDAEISDALKWPNIDHVLERLGPGGEVPSATCPDCGLLCYLIKEPKTYHLLAVYDDVEPEIASSHATHVERDAAAIVFKAKHGDAHGIYWLDIHDDGEPQAGSFTLHDLEGDDDDAEEGN